MTISATKEANLNTVSAVTTDTLRLKDILRTLPREVFAKNRRKAWTLVLVNVLMVGLGYWGLSLVLTRSNSAKRFTVLVLILTLYSPPLRPLSRSTQTLTL